jgi:serine/threonine protein kinase
MSTKLKSIQVSSDTKDAAFAEAVEQLTCLIEAGEHARAAQFIDENPDHAEKLRRLLPAIEALASLDDSIMRESPDPAVVRGSPDPAHSASGSPPLHGEGSSAEPRLLGDFRIVREIGRGGMGVVYEATQISLNRRVALKVLPLAAMLDARRLERFRHEAQAAAMLRHPHIVSVFSVGCERGVHYYAMDFIEGPSLAEVVQQLRISDCGLRIEEEQPDASAQSAIRNPKSEIQTIPVAHASTLHAPGSSLPAPNTREFFRAIARLGIQAAEALDYAHQMGVVHRDVKPSNLLIDAQSHLWITDFGLAMTQTDAGLTMTGDLLGTLRYMSPEQAAGKRLPLDHRTDVYSLGITLYELLTGRPAFDTSERAELLREIAEVDPPPLRKLAPAIPVDLETIVHKAIEKDAADRYATALDLADDLQRYVEDRTIVARRTPFSGRARKWLRRHTALAASTAAVLLLAVSGLAMSTFLVGRQAKRAEENLSLALAALEETLAESVVGDLIVEPVDAKRTELQRRGIDFYEKFAQKNGLDPKSWPTYRLLVFSELLDKAKSLRVNDHHAADRAYRDAIAEATQLVAATKDVPGNRARLIHALEDYSIFLGDTGRDAESLQRSIEAGELAQSLVNEYPDFPHNDYLQGQILYNRAKRYEATQPAEAERLCREALAFVEQAFKTDPNKINIAYLLASCRYNLAMYLVQRGSNDEASELWTKSLGDWRALTLLAPLNSEYHSRAGATLSNLAALANIAGDYSESRRLAQEALLYQKRALKLEPVYKQAKEFLRKHYTELFTAHEEMGDYQALGECAEEYAASLPESPHVCSSVAETLARCAVHSNKDETLTEAVRGQRTLHYVRRAMQLLEDASSRLPDDHAQFVAAQAFASVGNLFAEIDRADDAHDAWRRAHTMMIRVRDKYPADKYREFDPYLQPLEQKFGIEQVSDVPAPPIQSNSP